MEGILILALAYPAAIAVLFYLAFLRPVHQHQRKQRDELASLRVGDEVLTQAGFIAVIKEVRVPEEHGPPSSSSISAASKSAPSPPPSPSASRPLPSQNPHHNQNVKR